MSEDTEYTSSRWGSLIKPRYWQSEALKAWSENMKGVVQVVTGGGKTLFAQLCISSFCKSYPNGRIVIVVPTTALLDQWYVSLIEDYSVQSAEISCYSSDEKPKSPSKINLFIINSARSLSKSISENSNCMLIVDECHRAGSPKNGLALRGNYLATLGLSATPERDYDQGFIDIVQPVLGPVIYKYGYVDAAKDGIISPFSLHNILIPMLHDEEVEFNKLSKRISMERAMIVKGTGSEERLSTLLQRRGAFLANVSMRIPVAVKLAEGNLGKRTIIFHERVPSANRIKEILEKRKRSVTLYHAGLSPAHRRDNLKLYRRGVYDILVCCRALDEGINIPETTVAIIASSTASIRQRVQRLGRVLRPAKGKSIADIYTIYASKFEEDRLLKEANILESVCDVSWGRAG